MDRLCAEYVECKVRGDRDRMRVLQSEIRGLDTFARVMAGNPAATVLGVIYRSYRLGENSCAVADALGLEATLVRQTLSRLNSTFRAMTGQRG
jgi:hypothetical protein